MNIDLDQLTQDMDYLKDQEARLKFELKNVQEQISKIEIQLQVLLEQSDALTMDFGVYSFGWRVSTCRRFNQSKFGEEHPQLLEKYKTESTTKRFEFKINK